MNTTNRSNGGWAPDTAVNLFADQHWIEDGHFMMVPQGVSPETLHVVLATIEDQITPEQQVKACDSGALNTANKDTTLQQAFARRRCPWPPGWWCCARAGWSRPAPRRRSAPTP